MLVEALVTLMLVGLLAFVLYPVFRGRDEALMATPDGQEFGSRQALYGQIYELDFDYQVGKLTEEDYRTLRQQLVLEAARRLREERLQNAEIDRLLEEELARRRGARRCPTCDAEVPEEARFCHLCGMQL
jgi:hypothetical protein